MRSVFVFSAVEPRLIHARLDDIGERAHADSWVIDERLWISVNDPPNWLDGFDDVRPDIERELGGDVTLVQADVSGRIDGTAEARFLALAILALGPGLAFDDDTSQGWTAEALAADETVNGRKFFSGSGS